MRQRYEKREKKVRFLPIENERETERERERRK
jgi:hypothetical protein